MTVKNECDLENGPLSAIYRQLGFGATSRIDPVPTSFLRLSRALASSDAKPSGLDLAVLVRQCLRFHESQSEFSVPLRIRVPQGPNWPTVPEWEMVGVDAFPTDNETTIQAKPWLPHWLPGSAPNGVDAAVVSEVQLRRILPVPGDPFMAGIEGHGNYLSSGQRSTVRAALCAPPGSTLVVCLPTGEGKSFIFQAIALFGYGSTDGRPGVALVVTPTVSLALDHQRRAQDMGIAGHPVAYTSGMQKEERQGFIDRIRNGTQGLCFAAPEAVCGSLFSPLSDAASQGYLRTLVVDEAHLVDTWGANFRAEFQLLGGIRSKFLERSPTVALPRTLLLSATFTNTTLQTLRSLFPGAHANGGTQLVSSIQLRPEIEYWIAKPTSYEDRKKRVIEALTHMPRPAILYVTEVEHAQEWYRSLRELGFRRISMLTGSSSAAERRRVVDDWREQKLDMVVGTSAFGLGIDNPNVRTIVHACVPETLDRYYQEAGRGGRDGKVAASLIIPVSEDGYHWQRDDYRTARSLNRRRLLTIEVAHRRWQAMFHGPEKTNEGTGVFQLRIDASPGTDLDHIDMVGETNTGWNQRTLTLMANSGMIELLGPLSWRETESNTPADQNPDSPVHEVTATQSREVQRVKIIDPRHLELSAWQEVVEPHRKYLESSYRANLDKMFQFLEGDECAADLLASVYEVEWESSPGGPPLHCSSSQGLCRVPVLQKNGIKRVTETPEIPRVPWQQTSGVSAPVSNLLDSSNRLLVFYDSPLDQRTLRRWSEGLATLANCGVRNLIALPGGPIQAKDVQEKLSKLPIFASTELPPRDYLPPGPVAVILPPGYPIPKLLLRPRGPDKAHFIFAHRDSEAPESLGVLLRDIFEGPQLANLDLFVYKVNQ